MNFYELNERLKSRNLFAQYNTESHHLDVYSNTEQHLLLHVSLIKYYSQPTIMSDEYRKLQMPVQSYFDVLHFANTPENSRVPERHYYIAIHYDCFDIKPAILYNRDLNIEKINHMQSMSINADLTQTDTQKYTFSKSEINEIRKNHPELKIDDDNIVNVMYLS